MKNTLTILTSATFLVVTGVLAFTTTAGAIPPEGFNLYDANDVYLGQVLSISYDRSDGSIAYTTRLADVSGILQFNTVPSAGSLFDNVPAQVYFKQPDCGGVAYISPDSNTPWVRPWIVQSPSDGATYKVASSTTVVDIESYFNAETCTNLTMANFSGYKLNPVTLPFDLSSIALPYIIKD